MQQLDLLGPNLLNEYSASPNPCDKCSAALKPGIAQHASDLFCITEQGEKIRREGNKCGGGGLQKAHECRRMREMAENTERCGGILQSPISCSAVLSI